MMRKLPSGAGDFITVLNIVIAPSTPVAPLDSTPKRSKQPRSIAFNRSYRSNLFTGHVLSRLPDLEKIVVSFFEQGVLCESKLEGLMTRPIFQGLVGELLQVNPRIEVCLDERLKGKPIVEEMEKRFQSRGPMGFGESAFDPTVWETCVV